jgi:hypothetical protein
MKEKWRAKMIRVSVEASEGALAQLVQITAPSIRHALKTVREGKPARRVRPLFPIDPEAISVPEILIRRKVAWGDDWQWKQR